MTNNGEGERVEKIKDPRKEAIKGLLAINCFYNNEPDPNGKCYSTKCMMHQANADKIKENGCEIFKHIVLDGNHHVLNKGDKP